MSDGGVPLDPVKISEVSALLDDWLTSADLAPAPAPEPPPIAADRSATLLDAIAVEFDEAAPADVAPETPAPAAAGPLQRWVLFTSSGSAYGVRDGLVTEVSRVPKMTLVPRMPPWLRGVTSLRGDIVSVIDVRAFLGLDPTSAYHGRLMVVRLPDEEFSAALLVDEVLQIASVPMDAVKPPAAPLEGALAAFLTGVMEVGGRLVAALDLERLLRSAEIRQFEDRREAECEPTT